jgi:hypothetical protein
MGRPWISGFERRPLSGINMAVVDSGGVPDYPVDHRQQQHRICLNTRVDEHPDLSVTARLECTPLTGARRRETDLFLPAVTLNKEFQVTDCKPFLLDRIEDITDYFIGDRWGIIRFAVYDNTLVKPR